ncbi:beta-L-arabinofuranosidase domain-containing protein [Flavobacterium palustre]|uniref:beta-L-arabinofuranosidase domain-containing protein n=1 Tax=Flavobacterium palustre TaxID=1476463 RepID=UPI00361458BC
MGNKGNCKVSVIVSSFVGQPFSKGAANGYEIYSITEADRLLAPYLKEAGITPLKENYGNWENTGLDGHNWRTLSFALSEMYAQRQSANKERLDYMLDNLEKCQLKNGDGYIGGVPGSKALWADIAKGKIDAEVFIKRKMGSLV